MENATFDDLPEPSTDETPDTHLADIILTAHDENPVDRTAKPFIRYLGQCEEMSEGNFSATLRASLDGPLMDEETAKEIQMSIITYIARYQQRERFLAHWRVIRETLDSAFKHAFEKASKDKVSVQIWLVT